MTRTVLMDTVRVVTEVRCVLYVVVQDASKQADYGCKAGSDLAKPRT
ncbi:hypothetical protein [Streptomyces sp. NPDC101234]